ncbi:Mth938-like domain-containing protein [Betaproteobacteria bacterium]|nr:Mth938-like domain-containing protein [Betaproteobacteria bacterium]
MNSGLQPEIIRGKYSITSYGESFIEVNKELITTSCIISTDNKPIPWHITNVEQISKQEVEKLFENNPDVVLIGTGKNQIMLDKDILEFEQKGESNPLSLLDSSNPGMVVRADCMSTHAACRTFNVLVAEGRSVVTGLILEKFT